MTHDVFISHSTANKTTADAICHALEKSGIRCWIAPRDIPVGLPYAEQIVLGIEKCKLFLLVFSGEANHSPFVQKELTEAVSNRKTIFTFRIEDAPMNKNIKFLLGDIHWLDAYPDDTAFVGLTDKVTILLSAENNYAESAGNSDSITQPVVKDDGLQSNENPETKISPEDSAVIAKYDSYKNSLLEKAEQGDVQAQYLLGYHYVWGNVSFGTEDRYRQAFYWASKAAENGCIEAYDTLGRMYYRGAGGTHDFQKAFRHYKIAADGNDSYEGSSFSSSQLAYMYRYGLGCQLDLGKAEEYYLKAIKLGAKNIYGPLCSMYLHSNQDEKAEQCFDYLLEDENVDNLLYFQIASFYYFGAYNRLPNYSLAMKYFKRAADKGNVNAMVILGDMHFHETPIKCLDQAAQWYEKAAEYAHPKAQYILGYFCEYGLGVKQDYKRAMDWYSKAVAQGQQQAQLQLGFLSLMQIGDIQPDFERAFTLIKKCAEQGNNYAFAKLGELYETGIGCEKNETEAKVWFAKAALGGDFVAAIYLDEGSPLINYA